jgi:hypothetical protein
MSPPERVRGQNFHEYYTSQNLSLPKTVVEVSNGEEFEELAASVTARSLTKRQAVARSITAPEAPAILEITGPDLADDRVKTFMPAVVRIGEIVSVARQLIRVVEVIRGGE